MRSSVEKLCPPLATPIRSQLACDKLLYLSFAYVMGFFRPISDLFTGNILRDPTIGRRVFDLPKKRQGEKVSGGSLYTLVNAYTMSLITHCNEIHNDWISQTITARLSWGQFTAVSVIAIMFLSHFDVLYFSHSRLD